MGTKKEALNYRQHSEPSDASTPPPYSKKIKVKDIERDVEYTRSHMDDVIDELGERLHPRQLVHDFVDIITGVPHTPEARQVSHTTRDTVVAIGERIRHDPLPFAVIGAGLAWLAFGGRQREHSTSSSPSREFEAEPPLAHAAETSQVQSQTQQAEGAGEKAYHMGEKAKEVVSEKAQQTQDYVKSKTSQTGEALSRQAQQGRHEASHIGTRARQEASSAAHATSRGLSRSNRALKDTIEQYPLAAGAIALGAGALAGLLLPHSTPEDRYLHKAAGKSRDTIAQKARQAADTGTRMAAAGAAAVNQEVHGEGLAPEQLAEQARLRAEGKKASPQMDTPVEKAEHIIRSGVEAAKNQMENQEQRKSDDSPG